MSSAKVVLKYKDISGGFFCETSIRLAEIINFCNSFGRLPDEIDSSNQYNLYKTELTGWATDIEKRDYVKNEVDKIKIQEGYDDLFKFLDTDEPTIDDISHRFFSETPTIITKSLQFNEYFQYSDYRMLDFGTLNPFINKYFSLSEECMEKFHKIKSKYEIDFDNTIGVFYRGNDKEREVKIGSYQEFLDKINSVHTNNPNCKILIQTDENEFLDYCLQNFEHNEKLFFLEELPRIDKNKHIATHLVIPKGKRIQFGQYYLATTYLLSKLKFLITHTGNSGFWSVLYRGHNQGVYQYWNNWLS